MPLPHPQADPPRAASAASAALYSAATAPRAFNLVLSRFRYEGSDTVFAVLKEKPTVLSLGDVRLPPVLETT